MLKVAITKRLKDFQLHAEFEAGSGITGIIGPSGCGKSVTLQCLAGLLTPDEGEILLNDQPFYSSIDKINLKSRERNVGYVFQNYALFPHLTVEQNIEYGLKGLAAAEKKRKVSDIITKVQLTGYEQHYPSQLSGGQQQRVALARTLVTEPGLLLLDEPFSALDHHVKHKVEQELLSIIKENFTGIVLLVTHNMEEAYRLCDHLILYDEGKIIQTGKKEEVFRVPSTVAAAKVLGCANILPLDSIHEAPDHLACTVRGIALKIPKQPINGHPTHIGIFPENIHFTVDKHPTEHAYRFHIENVIKGIHQTTVTLKVENAFTIDAMVPHHEFDSLLQENYRVKLSPDHLFLLNDLSNPSCSL